MESVVTFLLDALPVFGPWLLLLLAFLETSFITGLVVPSGVATSVATVLAMEGSMELPEIVVAAAIGGAVGDSVGFFIGRAWGPRVLSGDGRFSSAARRRNESVSRLFGRHPLFSVTLARLISFVRTLMPLAAGMSGLTYRRYLPYQLAGLAGWIAIYVSIGVLSRESWHVVTQLVGAGGVAVFVGGGATIWVLARRQRARRRIRSIVDGA